jgi:hypothetical protein
VKTKQLGEHSADCWAVKNTESGVWGTPWAYLKDIEYRDSIGRLQPRGGRRWWQVPCNCTHCPAVLLIEEDSILVTASTSSAPTLP